MINEIVSGYLRRLMSIKFIKLVTEMSRVIRKIGERIIYVT